MMSSCIEVGEECILSKTELCGICKDTIQDQNKQCSSSKDSNGDAGDQEELSKKCSLIKLSTAPNRLAGVPCCNSPARCHLNSIYIWLSEEEAGSRRIQANHTL